MNSNNVVWGAVIVRIGKRKYYQLDLVNYLSLSLGKSKSEIRRLIEQRAIDLYWSDWSIKNEA